MLIKTTYSHTIMHEMLYTVRMASREDKANISAQETTPGHCFSRADLIALTTSYPLSVTLGRAVFSVRLLDSVGSINTEASHP